MADYMGKCLKQIGWKKSKSSTSPSGGHFTVIRTFKLPAAMRSTAAAVAVSSDGLRLAVTVQPPFYEDGHGSHGFLILCARTGARLASYLDGDLPGGTENKLEYPSAIEWLRGGMYAGHLAIADYNNGRVQIRNSETGALQCSMTLDGFCVSGVAELLDDNIAVVPHSSDAIAVFEVGALARNRSPNASNMPAPRWFGQNECGMPIGASGVDNGQTLAVSDGAHRCVLFFERVVNAASLNGRVRSQISRTKGPVSVAVDYSSGELVGKRDRICPREFGKQPPQNWRRLLVDAAEDAGDMRNDYEALNLASLHNEGGNHADGSDGEAYGDESDVSANEAAVGRDNAEEQDDSDSNKDLDNGRDSPWGEFGIWTSLGFDHKRGDMAVSDSGARYSEGSMWLS